VIAPGSLPVLPAPVGSAAKSLLLLDISRLIWRARRRGPTGIDRVELAYARHFLCGQSERPVLPVLHLAGLLFAPSPTAARRFVALLARRWEASAPQSRREHWASVAKTYLRLFTTSWRFGPWLRSKLQKHSGAPIFLVVSHHHVARDFTIAQIRSRFGAKTACFIHDLIPIDYPEYFERGWEARYQRLSSALAKHFDAVIANSEATAHALRTHVGASPAASPARAMRIASPGVRAFPRPRAASSVAPTPPYFVVLGTIEPRKNHLLLLNLWTRLAAVQCPPRLLVVGARGWENEQVLDMLERSRRLRGLVEEHNGLTDVEIGALLHRARALLLPSFAEGFGLPLAEALASGVPALCSNIPSFREVGRDVPEYLDPLDTNAWENAVSDYSRADSSRRAAQMQRLTGWRRPRWKEHFTAVEQLLGELDSSIRATPLIPQVASASA
jgi:glycosyltransferase involved in cell wall biosynthesis